MPEDGQKAWVFDSATQKTTNKQALNVSSYPIACGTPPTVPLGALLSTPWAPPGHSWTSPGLPLRPQRLSSGFLDPPMWPKHCKQR